MFVRAFESQVEAEDLRKAARAFKQRSYVQASRAKQRRKAEKEQKDLGQAKARRKAAETEQQDLLREHDRVRHADNQAKARRKAAEKEQQDLLQAQPPGPKGYEYAGYTLPPNARTYPAYVIAKGAALAGPHGPSDSSGGGSSPGSSA